MFQINNMTQMSCNFREQSKIVRTGGIPLWGEGPEPSQATLIASPLPPAWPVCHVVKPEPREFLAILTSQINWPKEGERAGWIAVWSSSLTGQQKPAQFRTRIVSDVMLLSYLDKFGLSVTVEAGQALSVLYSGARLYKGPSLAGLSQSTTTRSTGNISVRIQKVGHSNTRGTVSSLFFPAQNNCCT